MFPTKDFRNVPLLSWGVTKIVPVLQSMGQWPLILDQAKAPWGAQQADEDIEQAFDFMPQQQDAPFNLLDFKPKWLPMSSKVKQIIDLCVWLNHLKEGLTKFLGFYLAQGQNLQLSHL